MPGVVALPELVQDALDQDGDLFPNGCRRRHFAEHLTGLFVAERATVLGIHDEPAQTADRSCLHRHPTGAGWDADDLNRRRPGSLPKDPSTRHSGHGVIPIDNTLIDRDGMLIPDAGWHWDRAERRNRSARDYLFVNSVGTPGKRYPLGFRPFRGQEVCEAIKGPFRNPTRVCRESIDRVRGRRVPGAFASDGSFTDAEVLDHLHGKEDRLGRPRGYVGDLKADREREWEGPILKASGLAASVPAAGRKGMRIGGRRPWYLTATVPIPEVEHKVRVVILWHDRRDRECGEVLVTDRVAWEVSRVVRVYRRRGTGTETFHRDGEQQPGPGDCQSRGYQGQTPGTSARSCRRTACSWASRGGAVRGGGRRIG